jgi:hypothetical protein
MTTKLTTGLMVSTRLRLGSLAVEINVAISLVKNFFEMRLVFGTRVAKVFGTSTYETLFEGKQQSRSDRIREIVRASFIQAEGA